MWFGLHLALAASLSAAVPQAPVLIIGVGGGETGRVARALAEGGLRARSVGAASVADLPVRAVDYRGVRTVILGPLPRGAATFYPGQLQALTEWVHGGGGLVLCGGMDCFGGAGGRGGYAGTPLADLAPVAIDAADDFVAQPVEPVASKPGHDLLRGLPAAWPSLGEWHRLVAKQGAEVVVTTAVGEHPLLVAGMYGRGRVAALLTTWGWPAQLGFRLWPGFGQLWRNLVVWTSRLPDNLPPVEMEPRLGAGHLWAVARRGAGLPHLRGPGGDLEWAGGTSVEERTLDFVPRAAKWGDTLIHLWADYPQAWLKAAQAAEATGVALAVFVPQVGPSARFLDGTASGSHLPYDSPWHRVPDFYSDEWQANYTAACRKMVEVLAPYERSVAVAWLTNEPEIYLGWEHWLGPHFPLNTPACLGQLRRFAQQTYGQVGTLLADWNAEGSYGYAFADWDDFERSVLEQLSRDDDAGHQTNRRAMAWLLRFVSERWLHDWNAIATRLARAAGLTGPVFGVRHNYNSAPELDRLAWNDVQVCGKNLYAERWSDAYIAETWDAFRASGLPVLMSEWGVQPAKPPLGFVGGDEVTRAEQAALGRGLVRRCPWVLGDLWSNVSDIDFPWGYLDAQGGTKPFVGALGLALGEPRPAQFGGVRLTDVSLVPGRVQLAALEVAETNGAAGRRPGVRLRRAE